jgi:uncharacterized RDD family membrane protein YckC
MLTAITLVVRLSPLGPAFNDLFANPNSAEATVFVFLVLPVLLSFARFESSASRATPGKLRIGLTVVDQQGARISFARAVLRNALKLVPWEVAHASIWRIPGGFAGGLRAGLPAGVQVGLIAVYVIAGVYAVSLLITPQGRTLYDVLSGTVVEDEPGRRLSGDPERVRGRVYHQPSANTSKAAVIWVKTRPDRSLCSLRLHDADQSQSCSGCHCGDNHIFATVK